MKRFKINLPERQNQIRRCPGIVLFIVITCKIILVFGDEKIRLSQVLCIPTEENKSILSLLKQPDGFLLFLLIINTSSSGQSFMWMESSDEHWDM